jgi:hypothetical protein
MEASAMSQLFIDIAMSKTSDKKKARSRARTKTFVAKKKEREEKIGKENGLALRFPHAPPKQKFDVNLQWLQALFYPVSTYRQQIESKHYVLWLYGTFIVIRL